MRNVAAAVLAAGLSTRFGDDKLLKKLHGRRVVDWVIESLSSLDIRYKALVVKPGYERFFTSLEGFALLVNQSPWEGLSSSIRIAVRWAEPMADGLLLLLGDQPLVSANTIRRLLTTFLDGGYDVVAASRGRVPMNPAIFSRKLFPELLKLAGDAGAKNVILAHINNAGLIEVDEKELFDIDTPEDLEEAERLLGRL